jgi:hypothetical protein
MTLRNRRLVLAALAAYAIAGFFFWIRRTEDFGGYLWAGEAVLKGRPLYEGFAPGVRNTWPPFFALLAVPLALLDRLSPLLSRGVWIAASLASLLVVLAIVARRLAGKRLRLRAEVGEGEISLAAGALVAPLLLTDRFVSTNFDHLQVNLLLFALVLAGLELGARGRGGAGGVLIGFASAIKVMPLVFVPYLVWRRKWKPAAAAAASFAAFSLSPAFVLGPARFSSEVAAWRAEVAKGWGVGKMNQSVFALFDRLLGHGFMPLAAPGDTFAPESGRLVPAVATAVLALLVAGVALVLFRGTVDGSPAELCEWSAVFTVSALFSPVAWKAYFCVLLLPNALLFAAWRDPARPGRSRRIAGALLLGAALCAWLPSPGLVGGRLAGRLEMSSLPALSALILLFGSLWLRLEAGRQRPST